MIEMVKVRQVFEDTFEDDACFFDVEAKLREELDRQGALAQVKPGDSVGIAVGSRGIDQIDVVVKTLAEAIRKRGAYPEVFAAMGSHGGTEAGQLEVLKGLGISPEALGIPVKASLDCELIADVAGLPGRFCLHGLPSLPGLPDEPRLLGPTDLPGLRVYVNCLALSFDWIVVVNRVKPHTSFSGEIESGLTKMLAVGIGGPMGARVVHSQGHEAIPGMIERIGGVLIERLPIIAGVALVEDKRHRVRTIRVCKKEEFLEVDKSLLVEARKYLPVLPFEELDLLVVNKMGKCFSGTGMDTNVIGRVGIRGVPDKGMKVSCIVVLDLAEESQGNANGIGLADITTERLIKKIDYAATLKNVLTTSFLDRAKLPVVLSSDREAIETAVELGSRSRGSFPVELSLRESLEPPMNLTSGLLFRRPLATDLRIAHIDNTLEIEEFYVSPSLTNNPKLEVIGPVQTMSFDETGNFIGYL